MWRCLRQMVQRMGNSQAVCWPRARGAASHHTQRLCSHYCGLVHETKPMPTVAFCNAHGQRAPHQQVGKCWFVRQGVFGQTGPILRALPSSFLRVPTRLSEATSACLAEPELFFQRTLRFNGPASWTLCLCMDAALSALDYILRERASG